jgi:hypothetical protein
VGPNRSVQNSSSLYISTNERALALALVLALTGSSRQMAENLETGPMPIVSGCMAAAVTAVVDMHCRCCLMAVFCLAQVALST